MMVSDQAGSTSPSVAQRLMRGLGWSTLGSVGWRALTAAGSIMVARILSPENFGELGVVRSTINVFTTFAVFQLGSTASKHIAEFRASDPDRAARILSMTLALSASLCLLCALTMLIGAEPIARDYLNAPGLKWPLRFASAFMFFQAYSAVRETILIGTEQFRGFARVNLTKGASTVAAMPLGAWLYGVNGAVIGLSLAAVASFVVLEWHVRAALRANGLRGDLPFKEWRKSLPVLWSFALPGFVTGLLTASTYWIGRLQLVESSDGYFQLGLFEAANQWRTMILFIPGSLALVALPVIAASHSTGDERQFLDATALQFKGILAIALPLAAMTVAFSDELIALFGSDYEQAAGIFPTLMASVFIFALNQSLRRVMDGTGHVWRHTGFTSLWTIAFLVTLALGDGGADASLLARAMLVAEAVLLAVSLTYISRVLARGFFRRSGHWVAWSGLAMLLAANAQSTTNKWLSAAAVAASTLPLVFLRRGNSA